MPQTNINMIMEALVLAASDDELSPQERDVAARRHEFMCIVDQEVRFSIQKPQALAAVHDAACFVLAFLLLGVAEENEVERLQETATKILADKFLLREMLSLNTQDEGPTTNA